MATLTQKSIDGIVKQMLSLNFPHYNTRFIPHSYGHLGGIVRVYGRNNDREYMSAHIENNSLKGITVNNQSVQKLKKIIGINIINAEETNKFNNIIFYLNNHTFFSELFPPLNPIYQSAIYKYTKSASIFNMPYYAESQYLKSKIGQIEFTFRFHNLFKITRDGNIIPVPTISLSNLGNLHNFMVSLNVHTDTFYLIKNDTLVFEDLFEDNQPLDLEYSSTHFVDTFVDHIIKNWMHHDDPVRKELILLPKSLLSDKINILGMYFI